MNITSSVAPVNNAGSNGLSSMDIVVLVLITCLLCTLMLYCISKRKEVLLYWKQHRTPGEKLVTPKDGIGEMPHDGLSFGESYQDDKRSPNYQFEGDALFSSGEEVMVKVGQEWEIGFILKRRDSLYEIELMKTGKLLVNKDDVKRVRNADYLDDDSDGWLHLMEGDQVHFQPGDHVLCHLEGEWISGVVNSHLRNTYNILLRDGTLKLFNIRDLVPNVDENADFIPEPEPGSNINLLDGLEVCPEMNFEPGASLDIAVKSPRLASPSVHYRSDLEDSDSEGLEEWEDKVRRLRKFSEQIVE